ncbi:uncharacterized protein LOC113295218 [Papaver somniferum]|uniref:uncharacterized protein LOC113295218 n=1 Tax=Papaver somniferum TaxID=3469 RepID=UPI000E6F87CC|nr:uncharacterized protein LOC113295218 [Papaver somniferum]
MVLVSVKPKDVETDNALLRAFLFSLVDMSKEWFYSLPAGSITTWTGMKKYFLEKYFPASKVAKIRKEICGIVQKAGETLYEYWERYKRLCQSCPHHQITEQLIIPYFYEGLLLNDRTMIDAASGGTLVDKTPAQARALIKNMASNSQQFSSREETLVKKVNEVGEASHMEQRMCNMERMMQQISAVIVSSYEGNMEHANAMFQNHQRPRYDPYSNTYNPGWRDHPNFSYANKQAATNPIFNQQGGYQFMQRPQQETQVTSVDEKFTLMMQGMQEISKSVQGFNQFQQKYEMAMRDVQNQVNELIFLVDFYVLDMNDENLSSSTPLLLGRPFMRTSRTKIDVYEGTLTMEFDGEVVRFNIFEMGFGVMFQELREAKKVGRKPPVLCQFCAALSHGSVGSEGGASGSCLNCN